MAPLQYTMFYMFHDNSNFRLEGGGKLMPIAHVYYPENLLNTDDLKRVSKSIHDSLMEHFKVPNDDYFNMFFPYPSGQFFFNPTYLLKGGEIRTKMMIHVSITCGPGRTINQKKGLYQSISKAISHNLGISDTDVFITLHETPAENWSFGQGGAQMVEGEKNNE